MKILILGGAGMMGSGTARDLVSDLSSGVSAVHVADTHLARATDVVDSLGDPRLVAHAVDVADRTALKDLLTGMDLCINAVATMAGHQMDIFAACFAARVPYIDYGGLGVYTVKQKAEHARWRDAGLTAILSCGADPGMSNMICKAVAERLDRIERINLYWAASVDGPDNPILVPPYAVSTVLAEYALPSQQFFDGKLCEVPPMSGRERIALPEPWGETEFIHSIHSEPLTVPFAEGIADKGIQEFTWKLSLPRPEHDTWAALMRVGFRDFEDPIEMNGVAIKPGDFLARLIARNQERHSHEIPAQAGHEIHFADGAGTRDGQAVQVRCAITSGPDPLYDDYIDAGTSMNVSIAAQLLLSSAARPGVWGPEEYFEVEPYFAELEKRRFKIYRSA